VIPFAGAAQARKYNPAMVHDFGAGAARAGGQIASRLAAAEGELREQWMAASPVRHFFIDDLLPTESVLAVYGDIPPKATLMRKRSLRESKWVGVAIDRYHPSIGEHLLAFQRPEVMDVIARITGLRSMEADPSLYASGISVMEHSDFLNPHIDNSHDGDQRLYRVLNLLYYVSPGWSLEKGGNLELWTSALDRPKVIESRFNRLVVMATDDTSWHSVQPVTSDENRVCFSNYYFSALAPGDHEYRNVTSFRGRPEEPVKRLLLRADAALLNVVGHTLPFLLKRNRHRR
jgi:Rps23 Pro-64 3,4-dihydroxylase Tpa1-like proline 4-hydroxylase